MSKANVVVPKVPSAKFFRAYGYTLAVETIDSKIKLVAWDY